MTEPKPPVDWELIEREYRAGQLSVSEIARLGNCSHTAIQKKAKKRGWTRNLREKVREEVAARLVAEGVANGNARETIERAAERDIQLIRDHRKDISSGRLVVRSLWEELQEASDHRVAIEQAIVAETNEDGKRRAIMLRAVSLSSRSSTAANLAVALKNLVGIERQAFGLGDGSEGSSDGSAMTVEIVRFAQDPASE